MAKEDQNKDTTEKTEEIYRKLLRLYERLTAETTTIGVQGEALGKIIEELKAESSLATEFKVEVRRGIMESVDKVVGDVNNQIKSSIRDIVTKEVSEKVKEFKSAMNEAAKLLIEYAVAKKMSKYWMYLIVLFCGLICLFTGYTYSRVNSYMPDSRLTTDQILTYKHGMICETMWGSLSKKTQDRLMLIEKGKLPPEENSYEWIKEKNPKLDAKGIKKKFEELNGD